MQTPRLCIDGRAAVDFDAQGLLAQELIDQLVSAQGEPNANSEWVEKRRTVLLSHPGQVFAGQLKRFDTKRKIGSSLFYSAWEKHFIQSSEIAAFHRFRTADKLEPTLSCPTITTILPARKSMGSSKLPTNADHLFVVPSIADQHLLKETYSIPEEQIKIAEPSVRRFVHYSEVSVNVDGQILFLTDGRKDLDLRKLQHVVSAQYPHLPMRTIDLSTVKEFSPKQWLKNLQFTSICFYLTERNFDWPFLVYEALFYGVPIVFMDKHPSLSETLATSPLRLSKYLTDLTTSSQLKEAVKDARMNLFQNGSFDQHSQARHYAKLYSLFS